jgi:signal transduction histidine kinase/phage shock protein PspC (stress-responsive transcriptional regulator)
LLKGVLVLVRDPPHGSAERARARWSAARGTTPSRTTATTRNSTIATKSRHASSRRAFTFWRSQEQRVIAGVAGGFAERIGVDAIYVRASLVALAFAGGVGVFAYLLTWTLAEQERPADAVIRPRSGNRDVGYGLIVFGTLLALRDLGFWLGDEIVWPVVLVALGSSVVWARGDGKDRVLWTRFATAAAGVDEAPGASGLARLLLGGLLVVSGVATFLVASVTVSTTGGALVAIVITGMGVALILGPWIVRQAQQLTEERRERIRSQERAEVAAHLHDSVLQTLAMIQRSDSSRRMVSLARSQERELRAWLYGADDRESAERLQPMFEEVAARIEQMYDMPVELVVVGDALVDDHIRALSQASYEALQNAARHSQAENVSMYVEVEPSAITVFVRDEGKGFDPRAVPEDRRGISDSIVKRMHRHFGRVTIRSEPGAGTEIELQLPREGSR